MYMYKHASVLLARLDRVKQICLRRSVSESIDDPLVGLHNMSDLSAVSWGWSNSAATPGPSHGAADASDISREVLPRSAAPRPMSASASRPRLVSRGGTAGARGGGSCRDVGGSGRRARPATASRVPTNASPWAAKQQQWWSRRMARSMARSTSASAATRSRPRPHARPTVPAGAPSMLRRAEAARQRKFAAAAEAMATAAAAAMAAARVARLARRRANAAVRTAKRQRAAGDADRRERRRQFSEAATRRLQRAKVPPFLRERASQLLFGNAALSETEAEALLNLLEDRAQLWVAAVR